MLHKRRLIAFICLVAVLLAALTPAASTAHAAILVALDPLFGIVVIGPAVPPAQPDSNRSAFLEVTGSRGPPAL